MKVALIFYLLISAEPFISDTRNAGQAWPKNQIYYAKKNGETKL